MVLLSALVAPASGCADEAGDSAPPAAAYVVRDSAGVEIVESARPAWGEETAWRVSPEPLFSVGEMDGAPEHLLAGVEGALRTPDGGIVLANRQTNEVRFYDGEGGFVRSVGGSGEGPGEFEYLRGLRRCHGDTLFAFDLHNNPTLYTPEGGFLEERPVRLPDGGTPYALACGGGRYVAVGWGTAVQEPREGFYRSHAPAWILDMEGRVRAELGEVLASERLGTRGGSRPHPFGRSTQVAAGEAAVFLTDGRSIEVRMHDPEGHLSAIFRGPAVDLEVTEADIRAYRETRLLDVAPENRAGMERAVVEETQVDSLPALDALEVDAEGNVWGRRFSVPGSGAARWVVWSGEGVFLGEILVPGGLDLTEIGTDYLVGVARDELGVERVRVHGLEKR